MRRPATDPSSVAAYGSVPTSALSGSERSCPAITSSMSAQSHAVRAMGPTWSKLHERGTTPDLGTRPNVGLRPVMPHRAEGILMLPPVSVPMPAQNMPAATPFAVPELDPPAHRSDAHGLRGIGNGFVLSGRPI